MGGMTIAVQLTMRVFFALLVVLVVAGSAVTASACEPILPLAQLLSGAAVGAPWITGSLFMLGAAVAIKCAAFVFFEPRLRWREAVLFMLLANVYSTVPGVLVASCTGSISGVVLALPIVFILGRMAAGRPGLLSRKAPRAWSGGRAVLAFIAFFYFSMFAFLLAQNALDKNRFGDYWVLKFIFVGMSVTAGIAISTVLEEWAVSRFARKSHGDLSFYPSVLRANYITLGTVLLVAAIQILPKRLNSPHFLASIF